MKVLRWQRASHTVWGLASFFKESPSICGNSLIRQFLLYYLDSYKQPVHHPKLYPATIALTSLFLSIVSPIAVEACDQEEQNFLVTAYYSPRPNQSRYYLGSYEADLEFNGLGIEGNDGTPVYPGMIAAPPDFPFGTRIEIPEYGIVGTVHDRGGRIATAEDGTPHIDMWMGEGEEGLARALEWGARIVRGKAYHPQPENIPEELFVLADFPAPASALDNLPSDPAALRNVGDPRFGDTDVSVAAIQIALQRLGYFDHAITSFYGDVTRDSLRIFLRDTLMADYPSLLAETGTEEGASDGPGYIADETTRTLLVAHHMLLDELGEPLPGADILLEGTSGKPVRVLQRILSLLGLYKGEIDGIYDQELIGIVYSFQKERSIVSSLADTGAGMVGPATHRALLTAWRDLRIEKRGGSMVVASL